MFSRTTWFVTGSLLATLSIFSVTARAQSASVTDRYLNADALRKEGKNKEALAAINTAIWFDSDCGKCFGLRSGIEGNLQMFAEGVGDGDMGVNLSKTPQDKSFSAYNKGFNLGGLNRHSEALEAYNLSLEFDPTSAIAYFGKGKSLYFLGFWDQSRTALERSLKLNPKRAAAWAYLAEVQMSLGDAKAGLASANKAVELGPSDPRSFRARTIAHYWDRDYEAMLADATRTLELDPTRPHAHLLRGHAFKLLKREDESAIEYSLETDREAVEAGMNPPQKADLRIYNCGDPSTDVQTPSNFNGNGFADCVKRLNEQWDEIIHQLEVPPKAKRPLPSLHPKK